MSSLQLTSQDPLTIKKFHEQFKNIRIVLFDWDGTLNRDHLKHFAAMHEFSRKYNLPKIGITPLDLYCLRDVDGTQMHGSKARKTALHYMKLKASSYFSGIKRFIMYLYYEFAYWRNSTQDDYLYAGAVEMLQKLQKKGYILGVATNKDSYIVTRQLGYGNLRSLFTTVFGANLVLNSKPHPEMMFRSLIKINRMKHTIFSPDQILMVGDNIRDDILGGYRAGAQTALVHYSEENHINWGKDEPHMRPHLVLKSITDLDEFLPAIK